MTYQRRELKTTEILSEFKLTLLHWMEEELRENHSLARIRDSHFSFSQNSATEAWLRSPRKSLWSVFSVQYIILYPVIMLIYK